MMKYKFYEIQKEICVFIAPYAGIQKKTKKLGHPVFQSLNIPSVNQMNLYAKQQ